MRIKFNNKGFSIVEAVAACIILAILVLGVINLFPTSAVINERANREAKAILLAEELVETFRATPFDTLKEFIAIGNDTGSQVIDADGLPGGWQFTRKWALIDSGNIIQVDVSCYYPKHRSLGTSRTRIVTQVSKHD